MLRMILLLAVAASCALAEPGPALSAPGGRYVFGQLSDYRRDQYLLDTQTGRVWQIQESGGDVIFAPVRFDSTKIADGWMTQARSIVPFQPDTIVYLRKIPPPPEREASPIPTKPAPPPQQNVGFAMLVGIGVIMGAVIFIAALGN